MEYLIPIFLCLFLSLRYDESIGQTYLGEYHKNKKLFNFIFLWLVALSALQYCVGYDIPIYMDSYKSSSHANLSDIWGDARYRPGWLFLQYLCHKISDDFVALKIVQAVFLNFCVYKFLSRYSKYWYLTLFFYILYPYGQLNFGAMRQSFAVGFFLLSVPYLEAQGSKKGTFVALTKYYILVYLASLFHASAFVLFLLPLLKLFVFTSKNLAITIALVILGSFVLSQTSELRMILYSYIQTNDEIEQNARHYLTSDAYDISRNGLALIRAFVPIMFIYLCLYLNRKKHDKRSEVLRILLLAYLIMATLNLFIPIFYRLNDFFVFSYIVLIPIAIFDGDLFKNPMRLQSPILKMAIFFVFILTPVNHLVAVHPSFGFPGYRIYYPYHSVFDPQIDPDRNRIINYNL